MTEFSGTELDVTLLLRVRIDMPKLRKQRSCKTIQIFCFWGLNNHAVDQQEENSFLCMYVHQANTSVKYFFGTIYFSFLKLIAKYFSRMKKFESNTSYLVYLFAYVIL